MRDQMLAIPIPKLSASYPSLTEFLNAFSSLLGNLQVRWKFSKHQLDYSVTSLALLDEAILYNPIPFVNRIATQNVCEVCVYVGEVIRNSVHGVWVSEQTLDGGGWSPCIQGSSGCYCRPLEMVWKELILGPAGSFQGVTTCELAQTREFRIE
jgi:hypothetical protein